MGFGAVAALTFSVEPLTQKVGFRDILIYERICTIPLYRRFLVLFVATLVVAAAMMVGFVWLQGSGILDMAPWLVIIPVFYGLGTAAMFVWYSIVLTRRVRIAAFAWENDGAYADALTTSRRLGSAFRRVRQGLERQLVVSDDPRMPFELGMHYSIARDRQNGATIQRPFGFIEIPLPTAMPNLVLKNRRHSRIPTLGLAGRNAPLQLEGEFGTRFTLIAPPGYEEDALYVFTPDLMARIVDLTPGAEAELVGEHLYLYLPQSVRFDRPEVMQAALALIGEFSERFRRRTENYRDGREVIAEASGARVAMAGQRLRGEGVSLYAVAGILAVIVTSAGVTALTLFGPALFG